MRSGDVWGIRAECIGEASQRGSPRLCLFPVTVPVVQKSVRRWAAAAWTSGSGAAGCNGAESGGGTD